MMKPARTFTFTSISTGALVLAIILAPFSISQNPVDEVNGIPPGWSDEINLSNDPGKRDILPEIAVNGDNIHVVWLYNYQDIFYSKSIDCGKSWSPPINLYSDFITIDYPYIGVSGDTVHIAWSGREVAGTNRVMYCNSTDNGETWNPPKEIFNSTGIEAYCWGIYVNNSNIHIISEDMRDGANGEIYYRRSLDGGITFDDGQGNDWDRRITFGLTVKAWIRITGDCSNISIAWCDERDGDWEIYWMISKDNGFSWENGLGTPNVGRKLSDTSSDSLYPRTAIDGLNIHLVWVEMSWPGPVYRLYYRNSTDQGVTWDSPILLVGPWAIISRVGLDVQTENIHLVWGDTRNSTHEIFYKNSTDGGITWGTDLRLTFNLSRDSLHPKIAVHNDIRHIVWYEILPSNDREIYYKRYPDFLDTAPPDHTNELPPPDSYRDAPGTNVSVHVTDPSGVNETTIQLYVNGSLVTHTSTPITDGFNVSYVSPGFEPGVVECRIVADDNCSNTLDFTWNFTVLALYEIQLHEGWNLISVPHVQVDTAIDEVLRDIDGKWNYIQWYDASDSNDHWKTNATFKPAQLNDLHTLNHMMSFWINITDTDAIEVINETILDTNWMIWPVPISLANGNVINCSVYLDFAGSEWLKLVEGIDYFLNYETGEVDLSYCEPFEVGWVFYAYYNYSGPTLNLTVRGLYPGSTIIPLYRGWNLVGYPSLDTETVGNALFGTTADRVEVCDISEPYNIREVGPEYLMKPGEGYWVHVAADSIWTIEW